VSCLPTVVITEISACCSSLRICFTNHSRDISLNAKYLVLLKNVRDKFKFSHLARQVFPEDSVGLYRAYLDATQRPHGYLILHLSQDTDDRLRFRTNIFPTENPPVIYAPMGDKKDKIQLSRPSRTKERRTETTESHNFKL
jgi:hypothetical protein